MKKILRINLRTKQITYQDASREYLETGGRGLIAKIMLNEVNPLCDPLGRENKLIIANGLLTGTNVSSASRIAIGAKSPLTGGIKESNGGGITAMWLASLGIKALVVEDIPEEDEWYYIRINKDNCSLEPAGEYKGMGTFEFCEKMLDKYPDCAVTCIGQAGERLYNIAGIATMDKEKKPNRYSGRGGLGAVMGSKKLKGIVVEEKGTVEIKNKEKYNEILKEYSEVVLNAPTSVSYKTLGTAATVRTTNDLTGLPVTNFKGAKFEHAEEISGESLHRLIKERGGEGKTAHACMPGCIIQCSNVVPDEEGKTIVSPLEYETIGLMGSNLGIGDLDTIAKLNAVCNDLGVDTIETGAAMGMAMEAGIVEYGDNEVALNLLDEIRAGTELGKLLAEGTLIAGKALGVKNIPVINGQAMPAYDPRAIKAMGVTFATSPMGADHTYGPVIKSEDAVEASKAAQIMMAKIDCLGVCMFLRGAVAKHMDLFVDLVNAVHGWDLDMDWLGDIAMEAIRDEHKFNELAGFTKEDYRMPKAFTNREIESTNQVFDIDKDELDELRLWHDKNKIIYR
ncbi:MAG TPA: aldehyde ferredoxin oxidoreductase C-terminal domain-containing protein [Sedimentibacter sp.]|nr:aldehyde ferredoxin oxidoreductase [Sedimentibacter sp.]HQO95837.1 aldehyde ferredoxin oxidoreductase C-terminal domain-containing protein [Sedimentibacter sp.]